jgi:hypothetical protein
VATAGAACWALNKDTAIWLAAFERQVLRGMFGGIKQMKIGESDRIKYSCCFSNRCTVHFEFYPVHSPTNALFTNLVKSFKFTLKYTCFGL